MRQSAAQLHDLRHLTIDIVRDAGVKPDAKKIDIDPIGPDGNPIRPKK